MINPPTAVVASETQQNNNLQPSNPQPSNAFNDGQVELSALSASDPVSGSVSDNQPITTPTITQVTSTDHSSTDDLLDSSPSEVIATVDSTATELIVTSASTTQISTDEGSDEIDGDEFYQRSFELLVNAEYATADLAFKRFIERHPDHQQIPQAIYWRGEANYLNNNFEIALELFQQLSNDYQNHELIADAMLRMGFSLIELEQYQQAEVVLQQVIDQFPGESVANLAAQKLELISLLQ